MSNNPNAEKVEKVWNNFLYNLITAKNPLKLE